MWECSYAREPFDLRLLIVWGLRRLWTVLAGLLAGALIVGGGYYLYHQVLTGERLYSVTSSYEALYGEDPNLGYEYTYINGYTWNMLVTTDLFMDMLAAEMEKDVSLKGFLENNPEFTQQPEKYLSADLPSDLRLPVTVVTAPDPELAKSLNTAVQKAMEALGEYKPEIQRISVVDTEDAVLIDRTPRLLQAVILGAVSGALFVLFLMFCHFCMKDGILVPETFTFRFGIPALGAVAQGEDILCDADRANVKYIFREKKLVAVTAVDPSADLRAVERLLPKDGGQEYLLIPEFGQVPEGAEYLRQADGILLVVSAGNDSGRKIMHCLENLKIQGCHADGALLINGDRKLLNAYYLGDLPGLWQRKRTAAGSSRMLEKEKERKKGEMI